MTTASTNSATRARPQDVDGSTTDVQVQRDRSRVTPELSSRNEETSSLLAQLPPRLDKPGAAALKGTYFLIRFADQLGMSWAVKRLLKLNLGDVLSAVEFGADNNVLNTHFAANRLLDTGERKELREAIRQEACFGRAVLLAHFLNPDLTTLVRDQDVKGIKTLLDKIENVGDRKFLAGAFLLMAIHAKRERSAMALIDCGAVLDNSVFKGSNALIISVEHQCFEVTKKLIELEKNNAENIPDAYLDSKNIDGLGAVILAARNGHGAIFAALLAGGADPESRYNGHTAFHYGLLNGDTSICSAYLDHKKPATKAKAFRIFKDAVRVFQTSMFHAVNPQHSLELTVRALCRDFTSQETKEFITAIFDFFTSELRLKSNPAFRDATQAVFNGNSHLKNDEWNQIKADLQPLFSERFVLLEEYDDRKHIIQNRQVSEWAFAFNDFKNGELDRFNKIFYTKNKDIFDAKKYKLDSNENFGTLFRKIEQIHCAASSLELKAACTALPNELIKELINCPAHAKALAVTLREELKSDKTRMLRLVDRDGKKVDLEDTDVLSRLEMQLFAFEVDNILTTISNNAPLKLSPSKTSQNGEQYALALADDKQRLASSQQASDLLRSLQPSSAATAPFQLRLANDQFVAGLLQDAGSGNITVANAMKTLEAAQEVAGLLSVLESDAFEPLLSWAVPQFLAPGKRIAALETKQALH